ncbi:hypothetical protein IYW40_03065 [Methylocystis sp. H4A]|uniref:hypothetical protein n=1 Tax=Methylocystis sp. H4A TaxID=2785788 RepID=UPI0018C2169A|nr:hypothetical protein [Methylocystis sp. H4A]MBG0800477.1 hypothetical protein [Methylocystis sp. H4A]
MQIIPKAGFLFHATSQADLLNGGPAYSTEAFFNNGALFAEIQFQNNFIEVVYIVTVTSAVAFQQGSFEQRNIDLG